MKKRVKMLSNTSDHIVKHNKVHRTQTRALHKFKITDYITKFILEKFKVSLYTKQTISSSSIITFEYPEGCNLALWKALGLDPANIGECWRIHGTVAPRRTCHPSRRHLSWWSSRANFGCSRIQIWEHHPSCLLGYWPSRWHVYRIRFSF